MTYAYMTYLSYTNVLKHHRLQMIIAVDLERRDISHRNSLEGTIEKGLT